MAFLSIPLLAALIYAVQSHQESRRISQLNRISYRYQIVRQATNDFMLSAVSYLESPLAVMTEATERVRGQNLSGSDTIFGLQASLKELAKLVQNIKADNETSTIRAETHASTTSTNTPSVWKQWKLWIPPIAALAGAAAVLAIKPAALVLDRAFSLAFIVVSWLLMALVLRRLLTAQANKHVIERQTALTAHLFDIRREYIHDLCKSLHDQASSLERSSKTLHAIPQARGIFKGISWLEAISNRLERAHTAANLTEDAPLFALSAYLERALANEYTTMASANHVKVEARIEKGLAFRIIPADFSQLMTSLVDNAITYSKPGGTVLLRGKRTGRKIQLSIADQGTGIDEKQMATLFQPTETNRAEHGPPALNLHINKIIMARVSGELRVSSHTDKGTTVTIIAKKTRNRENFKIPMHIMRSSGVLQ